MKDTLIVSGNGLSVDLCKFSYLKFNTSKPLSWNFSINQQGGPIPWEDAFPEMYDLYKNEIEENEKDNFIFFKKVREIGSDKVRYQSRLFLAFAYTYFCLSIRTVRIPLNWKWSRFIRRNIERIDCLISFNYDDILERLISGKGREEQINRAKISLYHKEGYIKLFKPHGCHTMGFPPGIIDFDIEHKYPSDSVFLENNVACVQIPRHLLMRPRRESFCILPHENNVFDEFQWQRKVWQGMGESHSKIRHCLIVGHSYGHVDRPEINKIISTLPKSAIVHICNPYPDVDLIKNSSDNGNRVIIHKDLAPYELDKF